MTTTAEHLRNSLDGRWRDVKNQMRERLDRRHLPSALHTEHGDRPHQGGRADAHHGRRGRSRRQFPQRTRRQRQRRGRSHDDRDAGDVGSVPDGQGGCAVGPVRRGRRESGHRTPPRGVREEDHQPRTARLFRDDRDRTRQRRAGAGDHRHLRRGHRGVRDPLRDTRTHARTTSAALPKLPPSQRFSHSSSQARTASRSTTECIAFWCRSATTRATTCRA